jgi:hypothetical protein
VLDEHDQHDVLEHVREVAGVESVAVVHGDPDDLRWSINP